VLRSDLNKLEKKKDREDQLRPGFNSLLKFYGELKDPVKVWHFYQFMLDHGPSPNLITFNTVMAALNGDLTFSLFFTHLTHRLQFI